MANEPTADPEWWTVGERNLAKAMAWGGAVGAPVSADELWASLDDAGRLAWFRKARAYQSAEANKRQLGAFPPSPRRG